MKNFLVIYIGTEAGLEKSKWNTIDEASQLERRNVGMNSWKEWAAINATAIVDQGTPLGKTKSVSAEGIIDTKNAVTAYTIIRAESHEAAAKLFEVHPHLTIFPGDSVEIMECLPLPR